MQSLGIKVTLKENSIKCQSDLLGTDRPPRMQDAAIASRCRLTPTPALGWATRSQGKPSSASTFWRFQTASSMCALCKNAVRSAYVHVHRIVRVGGLESETEPQR